MSRWKARRCSEIQPTSLEWLWSGYLARGKLALFDGDPGLGKSLITLDLIARLTRGAPLSDGTPVAQPITCAVLSAEDEPGDTIRPRAEAAGADLYRLIIPDLGDQPARFPDDQPALKELIVERGIEFLSIDPLMAFLPPRVAANLDQCVRQALTPLANLASRTGCAIELVRHMTKQPSDRAILRGQGSMGIIGAVRTALFVAPRSRDPVGVPALAGALAEDRLKAGLQLGPECVLAVSKTNLSRTPPALGYRVVESSDKLPRIEWLGPVDRTADALCALTTPSGVKMGDRVVDWLKRELAGGPRKAQDMYAAAAKVGIPERSLERAKQQLPARSHRTWDDREERGEWYWYDPDAAWPTKVPFEKPFELAPLPPLARRF
jgi:AAA domain